MRPVTLVMQIAEVNETMSWFFISQMQPMDFDPLRFNPYGITNNCAGS